HSAVFHLHGITRNLVGLVPRFALAGAAMELVLVPGADHVVTIEPATTQRAADMIAAIGDDAKLAVTVRDGHRALAQPCLAERFAPEVFCSADVNPFRWFAQNFTAFASAMMMS